MIDLTDASDQVPPEDYPVLVFLRDQLVQARDESERLKQQLAELQQLPGAAEPDRNEAALAQFRAHYERLLDEEQNQRSELQASLGSERLLRMEAETKVEAAREELKRVRVELRTALKNEHGRAVEAQMKLEKIGNELARLKAVADSNDEVEVAEGSETRKKNSSKETEVPAPSNSTDHEGNSSASAQSRRTTRNKRTSSSSSS